MTDTTTTPGTAATDPTCDPVSQNGSKQRPTPANITVPPRPAPPTSAVRTGTTPASGQRSAGTRNKGGAGKPAATKKPTRSLSDAYARIDTAQRTADAAKAKIEQLEQLEAKGSTLTREGLRRLSRLKADQRKLAALIQSAQTFVDGIDPDEVNAILIARADEGLRTRLEKLDAVEKLASDLTALESTVEELKAQSGEHSGRLDDHEGRLDDHEGRLDGHDAELRMAWPAIRGVRDDHEGLGGLHNELNDQVQEMAVTDVKFPWAIVLVSLAIGALASWLAFWPTFTAMYTLPDGTIERPDMIWYLTIGWGLVVFLVVCGFAVLIAKTATRRKAPPADGYRYISTYAATSSDEERRDPAPNQAHAAQGATSGTR